jgi:hypothetical protein
VSYMLLSIAQIEIEASWHGVHDRSAEPIDPRRVMNVMAPRRERFFGMVGKRIEEQNFSMVGVDLFAQLGGPGQSYASVFLAER